MAEMRYPTVTVVEGQVTQYDDHGEPIQPYGVVTGGAIEPGPQAMLSPGTYALVRVPAGERMVVVVTEGGEWPEEKVRAAWENETRITKPEIRRVLDALAEGSKA
jgi:hypothetical protein